MAPKLFRLWIVGFVFALGGLFASSGSRAAPARSQVTTRTASKAVAKSTPTAVVYVSAHCGDSGKTFRNVCQQAIDSLRERGVAVVERDIFDARYRDEYVQKMRTLGRRPPAVPLVDVEGQLALGAHGALNGAITRALAGAAPRVHHEVGLTKPPSPKRPVLEPGERWVEPLDGRAVLYGANACPHCPAARKFLNKQGVEFQERNQSKPKYAAEVKAHAKRFGSGGGAAPSMYIFGRFLQGLDFASIEALVHWRRGEPKRASAVSAAKATAKPTAIVYVSPYCGTSHDVCQVAIDELQQNGVTVVERDIFDAGVRDEYVEKMQSIGRRPPAVPLIDLEGRLVLGADGSLHRAIFDAREGVQSRVRYPVGSTRPPAPVERVYDPGDTWIEPPDGPALLFHNGKSCAHCDVIRESLSGQGVEVVHRDLTKPGVQARADVMRNRMGASFVPFPSVAVFGRYMQGLDRTSIDALVHWRRGERKRASRPTK